jgi:type I restriction enzyme R subunit
VSPPPGRDWNEASLSEDPAVALLEKLGYTYVAPEMLDGERSGSLREVVLGKRLATALLRLNPWLSPENAAKAVRELTNVHTSSLLEASEKTHTALAYGISVDQDLGAGKKGQQVRFFDFEKPTNNELVVTRQYKVAGARGHIKPDIVVFVNGVPLAVVECKNPTLGDKWKQDALDQLDRYQELSERFRERGAPRLFEPVQLLIATCQQAACYGTVTTPYRFYAEWKSTWPRMSAELAALVGREPTPQDITLAGLLAPANLLDLLRSFVVFERDPDTGRIVRKVCRYQQFDAVNKAVERARRAKKPTDRGGVVWHTQGSGKSLTMLWLALKLRRDPTHENPTIVVVTDRTDLDDQITSNFLACGFPNPVRAGSVRHLRELLSSPTGLTVMTTVQKFQELSVPGADPKKRAARQEHPVLSDATNIFVLADEAHRTQYGGLAANLRRALPNAACFAFTGTPIDKKDRSTLETFGSYIDTYTIEQAVEDGATVPIFYESRLPEVRIIGNNLDELFDRVFADRSEEEREAIKKKYGSQRAVFGAPRRVEAICLDLIRHFNQAIRPNGFKAQVVASSREIAVLFKETLDRLNAPQSALVFSGTNDDRAELAKWHTTVEQRKEITDRFCKFSDPLAILVVCDMLLTGFDAPVEQVMYLDSPLKEHTLLQAIARVNRTADKKTYGLVVDYWGVSEALQEALEIFAPSDVKGALTPKGDELPRLQARHAAALRFFARLRAKERDDLDACVGVLEPEDVRAEFDVAFRRFGESLDMLLPDPRANPYVGDARWLGKIRAGAAARYRDRKLDISDCGEKVRALIEEAVIAEGIQILVKQVPLLSPDFEKRLAALKSDEARASEMEHAIRDEIHVKLEEDPAFYSSLRERLEQIVADYKAKRIDAAQQLRLWEVMERELRGRESAAEGMGLSPTGLAIYGLLAPKVTPRAGEESSTYGDADDAKVELASLLEDQLEPHVTIVDWQAKDDVQREMRRTIRRQLKVASVAPDRVDALAESIVDLMKRRRPR